MASITAQHLGYDQFEQDAQNANPLLPDDQLAVQGGQPVSGVGGQMQTMPLSAPLTLDTSPKPSPLAAPLQRNTAANLSGVSATPATEPAGQMGGQTDDKGVLSGGGVLNTRNVRRRIAAQGGAGGAAVKANSTAEQTQNFGLNLLRRVAADPYASIAQLAAQRELSAQAQKRFSQGRAALAKDFGERGMLDSSFAAGAEMALAGAVSEQLAQGQTETLERGEETRMKALGLMGQFMPNHGAALGAMESAASRAQQGKQFETATEQEQQRINIAERGQTLQDWATKQSVQINGRQISLAELSHSDEYKLALKQFGAEYVDQALADQINVALGVKPGTPMLNRVFMQLYDSNPEVRRVISQDTMNRVREEGVIPIGDTMAATLNRQYGTGEFRADMTKRQMRDLQETLGAAQGYDITGRMGEAQLSMADIDKNFAQMRNEVFKETGLPMAQAGVRTAEAGARTAESGAAVAEGTQAGVIATTNAENSFQVASQPYRMRMAQLGVWTAEYDLQYRKSTEGLLKAGMALENKLKEAQIAQLPTAQQAQRLVDLTIRGKEADVKVAGLQAEAVKASTSVALAQAEAMQSDVKGKNFQLNAAKAGLDSLVTYGEGLRVQKALYDPMLVQAARGNDGKWYYPGVNQDTGEQQMVEIPKWAKNKNGGRFWIGTDADWDTYTNLTRQYRTTYENIGQLQQRYQQIAGGGQVAAQPTTTQLSGAKLTKLEQWKKQYPNATLAQIEEAARWISTH